MANAYVDTINGDAIRIAIDAVAWAQPDSANWFARCRELNRLLRHATHLLCVPSAEKTETTWYAGVAGISLAAGIERMALTESVLRNTIVAFPLDTRIYVANVQKGLVREEWVLYPDAFDNRLQVWRAEGYEFVVLTDGGRLGVDLPNAVRLPVDIDAKSMSFRHASLALFASGLLRWRDCVTTLLIVVCAISVSLAVAWWHLAPTIDPIQRVAALVAQPVEPVRYNASAELGKLAILAADHDIALWQVERATELNYNATDGVLALHLADETRIRTSIDPLPATPEVASVEPYSLATFANRLDMHLASPKWSVTFGAAYPIGTGTQLEQHVTILIKDDVETQTNSVAAALVELSERLLRLPISLYEVHCSIAEGIVSACELRLAIRGLNT